MRRVIGIAFLAVALLLGSFTLTSASASDDHGDTIRLMAESVSATEVDLGEAGFSTGDQLVFSDDLFWRGELVGSLDGVCTVTRLDEAAETETDLCVVTATLPKGQISVQGAIMFDADFDGRLKLGITGGTGRYDDAAGEVKVQFLSETETKIKVELE